MGEPKAVVLLSGGLDSTTVLADRPRRGLRALCAEFPIWAAPHGRTGGGGPGRCRLGARRHVIADIDLRVFGGSALTDDAIDVPHHDSVDELAADIPVTYVPARNTIFLSFALAWAETLGASDVFIGVNALDYSGYPGLPSGVHRGVSSGWRTWRPRRESKGTQRLKIHTPLIELTKAQIIQRGLDLGRRLRVDPQLLRPGRRPCVRHVRLLPAARTGFAELGLTRPGIGAGQLTVYRVKEIFYTLQGEGSHAGRPAVFCRFTSCNLWTGRERDRHRAICQFCDTDFVGTDGPGGGRFATATDLAAAVAKAWQGLEHPRSRPLRRVHRRGAAAATRRKRRSTRCTPRASRWRSRPTAPGRRRPASTGSA